MPDMLNAILQRVLEGGIEKLFAYVASIGGVAAALTLLIELARKSQYFPFLTEETSHKAMRAVAIAAATASGLGLNMVYDGAVGRLTVEGLTPGNLAAVIVAVASQFGVQQLLFNFIIKKGMRK